MLNYINIPLKIFFENINPDNKLIFLSSDDNIKINLTFVENLICYDEINKKYLSLKIDNDNENNKIKYFGSGFKFYIDKTNFKLQVPYVENHIPK